MGMRLQKLLARAGVASRRASERLIRAGRVQVNGRVVTAMGTIVDPAQDAITVDGQPVRLPMTHRYIKIYKPTSYLSVMHDERGRRALEELLADVRGLHPVGRLDRDSEGLVLLTDDGELTYRLTHPRYEHTKEYLVLVRGKPTQAVLGALRRGVLLDDGPTAPAQVELVDTTRWGRAPRGHSWLRVTIHEGRKRQVRRMCAAVGHVVRRLIRVRMGPVTLDDLTPGEARPLGEAERRQLLAVVLGRQ